MRANGVPGRWHPGAQVEGSAWTLAPGRPRFESWLHHSIHSFIHSTSTCQPVQQCCQVRRVGKNAGTPSLRSLQDQVLFSCTPQCPEAPLVIRATLCSLTGAVNSLAGLLSCCRCCVSFLSLCRKFFCPGDIGMIESVPGPNRMWFWVTPNSLQIHGCFQLP